MMSDAVERGLRLLSTKKNDMKTNVPGRTSYYIVYMRADSIAKRRSVYRNESRQAESTAEYFINWTIYSAECVTNLVRIPQFTA